MVIDTSALLAILFGEPERDEFARLLSFGGARLVGAVNALEAAIVTSARKGPTAVRELDLLLHAAAIEVVAFDNGQLGTASVTAPNPPGFRTQRDAGGRRPAEIPDNTAPEALRATIPKRSAAMVDSP